MKSHYTYRLIALNPVDERVEYIGVRSCNGLPENDTRYQGSSKHLPRTIQYRKEIIAVWPTREEAVAHEVALHDFHDVARSPRFFNKAKQTSVGFDTAGITQSIEFKESVSAALRGVPKSKAHAAKVRDVLNSPEVKAKLRAKSIEANAREDVKRKISESSKSLWQNELYVAKTLESRRCSKNREARAKETSAMWENPEWRAKQIASRIGKPALNKGVKQSEEQRAGTVALMSAKRAFCIEKGIKPGKFYINIDKAAFANWLAQHKEAA